MNRKASALELEDYKKTLEAIQTGFTYADSDGKNHRFYPNPELEAACQLEATLGMRIGDILDLNMSDIVRDGGRYRLEVKEKKTGKAREFTVPDDIYFYICRYYAAIQEREKKLISRRKNPQGRKPGQLFTIKERAVQKDLQIVSDYLNIERLSSHSFRKTFATNAYIQSDYNIELVRQLLQHSSISITQRYIGISSKQIENALTGISDKLLIG